MNAPIRCLAQALAFLLGAAALNGSAAELLVDPLDGTGPSTGKWKREPSAIVEAPGGGKALACGRGTSWDPAGQCWAGDQSWTSYRIEVEVLLKQNWAEIDFHVQNDGMSGCALTIYPETDGSLEFEHYGLWGAAGAFKLWPIGQRHPKAAAGEWLKVRLEVGADAVNVWLGTDEEPVATFRDLAFPRGGVRLTAYAGSAYFRNLRITSLPAEAVKPLLSDPWAEARKGKVLRSWTVSPASPPSPCPEQLPAILATKKISWKPAPVDGRGVVHLTQHFATSNNTAAVAYARTTLVAANDETRRLALTYTDNFALWCNGERVFVGPPREWFNPERKRYGNSRLIPDQFEVEVKLRKGPNTLVVRSGTTEPFGWGFWMRELDPAAPSPPSP